MRDKLSLKEYLNKLADKTPTPGGGSAAALSAALGVALISMAGKYILKKVKDRGAQKNISKISKFSEKALYRLKELMREDEKAYLRLAREFKKRRPLHLLKLYKDAIEVPLEVCSIAGDAASNCARLCMYARTSIISDIAEAVILLESAFLSAKLNVDINLRSIEDSVYKNKINKKLRSGEAKVRSAKKNTLKTTGRFLERG